MERFLYYRYAYVITIPVILLALLVYPLVYICAAAFFISSVWLIIEQTQVEQYPSSSAATHYQLSSRFNMFNYAIAGYIVFSALVVAIFFHPISVFIMWTGIIVGLQILIPRYLPRLHLSLIVSYISQQLPDIDVQIIEAVIYAKIQNPQINSELIQSKWGLDLPIVSSILGYYENYLQRNSAMFKFVPAFITKAEEVTQHLGPQKDKDQSDN